MNRPIQAKLPLPDHVLTQVLRGEIGWEYCAPMLQDQAMKYIVEAAQQIMAEAGKGERRNMLGRIPASIRPKVEAEVMRIHRLQKMPPAERRDEIVERAALMEFVGGYSREDAERMAGFHLL